MAGFVERDRCPLCASGALQTLRSIDFAHPSVWSFIARHYAGRVRRRELGGRLYEVARCAVCDLSFQRFVLNDGALDRLYEEWQPASANTEPRSDDLAALLRHSHGEPPRMRVLDFAAGSGEWAGAALEAGFDVVAIEPSDTRRKHLRELGIDCRESLDEIARASIDYAHCDGVFEHLSQPVVTLRAVADRLSPGGIARIEVPDATRATRDIAAEYWSAGDDALRPLEHINGFSVAALRALGRSGSLEETARPRRRRFGRSDRKPLAIELTRPRR